MKMFVCQGKKSTGRKHEIFTNKKSKLKKVHFSRTKSLDSVKNHPNNLII